MKIELLFILSFVGFCLGNALSIQDNNKKSVAKATTQLQHPNPLQTIKTLHQKLTSKHSSSDFLTSTQNLINRVLSRAGIKFEFHPILEIIPYDNIDGQDIDVFEIDTKENQIVFRGSNGIALTAAFGHYLRYYLNCDFHWERSGGYSFASFPSSIENMPLPTTKEHITFLSKWRYYQNTCTTSYSFVWRTWSSWEMEIDWMAMNGFNLPLAFTGQEIVWQKLWKEYGVSEESLQAYFSGKILSFIILLLFF